MAFKVKEPVRTKLVINNKPIEQIQQVTCLGCDVSCDYDHDVQKKLHYFQHFCRTIIQTLKGKTRPES